MKTPAKSRHTSPLPLLLVMAIAGSLLFTAHLQAATQTWKVGGTADWEAASSWNTAVPVAGDTALLVGSGVRVSTITNPLGTAAITNLTMTSNMTWYLTNGPVNFGADAAIRTIVRGANASSLIFNAEIHAAGNLTVSGGRIELNKTGNTIGGDLTMSTARLQYDGPSNLSITGNIVAIGTSHNIFFVSGGDYTNNLILSNTSGTMQFDAHDMTNKTLTLSGQISGGATTNSSTFNVGSSSADGGTYVISGDNTYNVRNTILGAVGATNTTVRITSGTAFGTASETNAVSFRAGTNQSLVLDGGDLVVSNRTLYLGGSGQGVSNKGGLQTLSGSNTWGGDIVLDTAANGVGGGWIGTATNTTLHVTGVVSSSNGITKLGAGTLILSGDNTYTGNTTVSEGTLQLGAGGTSGTIVGAITNNATLVMNRSDNFAFSNTVAGTGNFVKAGAGALSLSGDNTYTGNTAVNEGILLLENVSGSGTGTGDVSVASGAAIGGDGSISGDLSLASGAKFVFDINKTLTVSGSVSLDSSFGIASLLGLDNSTANGTYILINGTGTDFSALGLQNWGELNAFDLGLGKSAYFSQGSLEVTVVPEPGTLALLGLSGVLGLALLRRRK